MTHSYMPVPLPEAKKIGHIYDSSNGEYLPVFEGWLIGRQGWPRGSGKWLLTGAVEYNNFGHVVRRYSQEELLSAEIPWTHKNGKQRTHLTDLDHGTRRTWGGRNHHFCRLPR